MFHRYGPMGHLPPTTPHQHPPANCSFMSNWLLFLDGFANKFLSLQFEKKNKNKKHTWHAITRPETNTWKQFRQFLDCSARGMPSVAKISHPLYSVSLLHFCIRQVLRCKSAVQCKPTWRRHVPHLPDHCYKWWKDSPLTLFHVKQKHLNTTFEWKLWQWNIPEEKHEIRVWKRSFEVTWVLLPLYMMTQVISAFSVLGQRQRTQWNSIVSVSQPPSSLTCKEVEEGGWRLH